MGCSLAASLTVAIKEIQRRHRPDFLFIEPSEMVVSREMREVAAMGRRDVSYSVGPLISLVDGPLFDFLWQERRQLLLGQVNGADLVAVSRSDLIDVAQMRRIQDALSNDCDGLLELSTVSGAGVSELIETVRGLDYPARDEQNDN